MYSGPDQGPILGAHRKTLGISPLPIFGPFRAGFVKNSCESEVECCRDLENESLPLVRSHFFDILGSVIYLKYTSQ